MRLQGMEPFKSSLEYLTLPHAGFARRDLLMAEENSVVLWRGLLSCLCLCFAWEPPASSSSSSSPPQQLPFCCGVWDACHSFSKAAACLRDQPRLKVTNPLQHPLAARL